MRGLARGASVFATMVSQKALLHNEVAKPCAGANSLFITHTPLSIIGTLWAVGAIFS